MKSLAADVNAVADNVRSMPDRVKVLHLNAGNMYGGVETILSTLARLRHLSAGMEPHFATCYEGRSRQELEAAGVPVYPLGQVRISRPWTVLRARRRLLEILRREHFDLVICHMAWTWVVFGGVARAAGERVAMWAHGFQDHQNWLERMAERTPPDFVIANSHFTGAWVREHFPITHVNVLYCPVELRELPNPAHVRADLRAELEIDDATPVILQAGRMELWKGHTLHLQALAQLKDKKWALWIAGGPQTPEEEAYFRQLQVAASELGISDRVRFLGQRGDIPQLMAAADIFCQPNQGAEPFGIVFIEALWAGKPVITSALGGALEIVDESCGLLTAPGDAQALARALAGLIESKERRERLGLGGPARARQLCDPATQIGKLAELSQSDIPCRRTA